MCLFKGVNTYIALQKLGFNSTFFSGQSVFGFFFNVFAWFWYDRSAVSQYRVREISYGRFKTRRDLFMVRFKL